MEQTPKLELEPFFDRVFIERDETVDKTAGGVIIPETEKEKPNKGIVIVAGPDCKSAFPGQKIIFGRDYGFELMISGREITVLREGDIYAGSPRPPMTDEEIEEVKKLLRNSSSVIVQPEQSVEGMFSEIMAMLTPDNRSVVDGPDLNVPIDAIMEESGQKPLTWYNPLSADKVKHMHENKKADPYIPGQFDNRSRQDKNKQ
jgi:chaperonin GroES